MFAALIRQVISELDCRRSIQNLFLERFFCALLNRRPCVEVIARLQEIAALPDQSQLLDATKFGSFTAVNRSLAHACAEAGCFCLNSRDVGPA